jgi:MFS family permease
VSHKDDADRPATFREVLASGEYRALYLGTALSLFGDYVARAAVTALVYERTGSVAASAATFAISYVPWLGLGPILAALAERLPYRRTMIVTDLIRMVLIALVAIPSMPVWGIIALLFATSLCNPPFEAARSALTARVLDGDRYVAGITLTNTTNQVAQVVGYLSGAGLSTVDPQAALLFNAATFGISACLIGLAIHPRPAALAMEDRTDLLRETADGLGVVFRSPMLRSIALLVFTSSLVAVVPEGLAAAWAADLVGPNNPQARGWIQGTIMISNPLGYVVGGLIVGRFLGPKRRQRLVPFFAIAGPATLIPAVLGPPVVGVAALSFASGVAAAGLLPPTNGLFVQALPDAYRARAFGVMRSGVAIWHGVAIFITGALADRFNLPTVVGLWGVFGLALMIMAVMTWPGDREIAAEIERVRELNGAAAAKPERWRAPSPGSSAGLAKNRDDGGSVDLDKNRGDGGSAAPQPAPAQRERDLAGPSAGPPTNTSTAAPADPGAAAPTNPAAGTPASPSGTAPFDDAGGADRTTSSRHNGRGRTGPEPPAGPSRQPGRHRAASV